MGINIGNGYRLSTMTLSELQHFCESVRKIMSSLHREMYIKHLASNCTKIIDMAAIYPEDRFRVLLGSHFLHDDTRIDPDYIHLQGTVAALTRRSLEHRTLNIEQTNRRDPEVDFSFNFNVIPYENELFALIYTEQEEMRKRWESLSEVTEFRYFNHTDAPDGIDQDQWDARYTLWKKVLQGDVPNLRGFQVQCTPVQDVRINLEDLLPYVPQLQNRINRESKNLLLDRKFFDLKDQYGNEKDHFILFNEAERWMRSEDGKDELARVHTELSTKLKSDLSVIDFSSPISSHLHLKNDPIASSKLCAGYVSLIKQIQANTAITIKLNLIDEWIQRSQVDIESFMDRPLNELDVDAVTKHIWRKSNNNSKK